MKQNIKNLKSKPNNDDDDNDDDNDKNDVAKRSRARRWGVELKASDRGFFKVLNNPKKEKINRSTILEQEIEGEILKIVD